MKQQHERAKGMTFFDDLHTRAEPILKVGRLGPFRPRRLLVALLLLALAIAPGGLGALTRELMTDAYVQVSAFVAATLMLFYGAERLFKFDIGSALQNAKGWQVPLAALLGATPGCGGAVIVVAAYSSGHVGFLLIATRPEVAAVVLPLSFAVGIISGYVVDLLDKVDYRDGARAHCDFAPVIGKIRLRDWLFLAAAIPGLVIGVSQLAFIDTEASFGAIAPIVALIGTAIIVFIWSTSPLQAMTNIKDAPVTRMAEETSFIGIWVIGAYLAYDYIVAYGGFDLEAAFNAVGVFLPMIAILVGFIPGCGPQVLVATLFINGLIPFAALIGNSISNDGDALFPAIALNPKAAVLATAYSAVPAIVIAYGVYFFAPGLF